MADQKWICLKEMYCVHRNSYLSEWNMFINNDKSHMSQTTTTTNAKYRSCIQPIHITQQFAWNGKFVNILFWSIFMTLLHSVALNQLKWNFHSDTVYCLTSIVVSIWRSESILTMFQQDQIIVNLYMVKQKWNWFK